MCGFSFSELQLLLEISIAARYPWGAIDNLGLKLYTFNIPRGGIVSNNIEEGVFMNITVSKNRCPQNHPCPSLRVCPAGAMSQNGFEAPTIDQEKCISCKKCVKYCPMGAIQATE